MQVVLVSKGTLTGTRRAQHPSAIRHLEDLESIRFKKTNPLKREFFSFFFVLFGYKRDCWLSSGTQAKYGAASLSHKTGLARFPTSWGNASSDYGPFPSRCFFSERADR